MEPQKKRQKLEQLENKELHVYTCGASLFKFKQKASHIEPSSLEISVIFFTSPQMAMDYSKKVKSQAPFNPPLKIHLSMSERSLQDYNTKPRATKWNPDRIKPSQSVYTLHLMSAGTTMKRVAPRKQSVYLSKEDAINDASNMFSEVQQDLKENASCDRDPFSEMVMAFSSDDVHKFQIIDEESQTRKIVFVFVTEHYLKFSSKVEF